jgi:NAD(P)-dependent dehydrogenase (short-subunit alcohol dehydrogenase family)
MGSLTFGTSSIPDLNGKVFIVTGGNSGVGYECARQLALHNGHVIIVTHGQGSRWPTPQDELDGPGAVSKIISEKSDAKVEYQECDLSSFRSIKSFADSFLSRSLPLHCLINNAGLQTPPDAKTEDGFEITLGVNFFGPFYLTQLLLPALRGSSPSRIVWVSSPDEVLGETHWDDIRGDHSYSTDMTAYGTSKLWDLMVGLEMNNRLQGTGIESFACHPGICRTDLFRKADHDKMASVVTDWMQWLGGQTAASGALALLYCATSPDLEGKGGTFYGPYYKGPITLNLLNTQQRTPGNPEANDPAARARLYEAALNIVNEASLKVALGDLGSKLKVGEVSHVEAKESTSAPAAGGREAPGVGTTTTSPAAAAAAGGGATSTSATTATQTDTAAAGGGGVGGVGSTVSEMAQKVSERITSGAQIMASKIEQGMTALGLDEPATTGKTPLERTLPVAEAPAGIKED